MVRRFRLVYELLGSHISRRFPLALVAFTSFSSILVCAKVLFLLWRGTTSSSSSDSSICYARDRLLRLLMPYSSSLSSSAIPGSFLILVLDFSAFGRSIFPRLFSRTSFWSSTFGFSLLSSGKAFFCLVFLDAREPAFSFLVSSFAALLFASISFSPFSDLRVGLDF